LVHRLVDAGVREIEAASFAHPKVLPQLADAAEVKAAVPRRGDVTYRGLVPNLRGAQRARGVHRRGVETRAELDTLARLGVTRAQSYLVTPPTTAPALDGYPTATAPRASGR
jgi:isopropylmalate/homocitrate/citramalate synthase